MTFANPEHLGETRRAAPLAGGLSGPMLGRAVGDAFVSRDVDAAAVTAFLASEGAQ